ncbi:MAG: carbohydrate kinase family protein [Pseudomonadales bacterium]|nr:carbohydrate kinase family protein [Pseudomonadales bacterium]
MGFDVVTIGSATVDYFADTDSELIKIQTRTTTEELIAFPLGSKLLIQDLNITTGGGGTNTAVAFARLGFKTGYLGKVGSDSNGDLVISKLAEEGIEFIGPRDGQTGLSMILNSIQQDRSILAYKGANNYLQLEEIKPFETQWVYLSSMLGQSFDSIVALLQKQDCKIAFNPSNYQAELGYDKLSNLIDCVEIIIMNKEEATKFLGLPPEENHTVADLMKKMGDLPPKITVITDGSRGAYVYDGEKLYHGEPREDLKVVEATGAGDAFAASFTAAQMLGKDTADSLHLAMTNAESVLQYKGAKERLLSRAELLRIAETTTHTIHSQSLS